MGLHRNSAIVLSFLFAAGAAADPPSPGARAGFRAVLMTEAGSLVVPGLHP